MAGGGIGGLEALLGPGNDGLAADDEGFVLTGDDGRVAGAERTWAIGDGIPIDGLALSTTPPRRANAPTWADRGRVFRSLTFWLRPAFVLRVINRFQKVAGFDRAIALASSALTALIPFAIAAATVAVSVSDQDPRGVVRRSLQPAVPARVLSATHSGRWTAAAPASASPAGCWRRSPR